VCIDLLNSPDVTGPRLGVAAKPLVPLTVFGELCYGAFHSRRIAENLQRIEEFKKVVQIILPDWETALSFGQVRHRLVAKGKTIPDDDMWIAALALQRNLPLITRDRHFREVDGLAVVDW
jgi:tRNA(fMet)-specific endonuclease VapC